MNTNRDYLIILDVKSSTIKEFNKLEFYINDEESPNIFVQLVVKESHDIINKYVPIDDPNLYELTMNIVKPTNEHKIITGELISLEDRLYEFKLPKDCCDKVGTYKCELETIYNSRITNSNRIKYRIKKSVLNDLDNIVDAPGYPIVIQLLDKLSDIDQYEEDRRANELARQLAEQQRQTRFNELDTDVVDRIASMDDKMADVEDRVSAKEQAVDKLIVDTKKDIDDYKVAKDTEIDEYKTAKDTEINNAIATQDNKIDTAINAQNDRITVVENNDVAQDNRLDVLENKDVLHESRLDVIEVKNQQQDSRLDIVENKNTQQDNRLDVVEAKNVEQDNRLNEIEAIDVAQNSRLDAIEVKNQQQDDRLLDIEKVNKRQDMNLKCLFAESKNNMIDITEEGNSIYLQNSTVGYTLIDEIKGNTLVNCNKEPDKELILNGNINTSGDNTVTLTEGVDGGLVDVALEGNTLVNVSKTKDSTAITKAYTVENSGNHIALQGDTDGNRRPVITGNTLWIDNDTEEVLTEFDNTKNLRLQSSFEDNLVTQEMVDSGEEEESNLGKYKVEYRVTGKNKFNLSKLVVGSFNTSTGVDIDNNNACRTGFIKLEPATYKLTKNTRQWQTVIGCDNKFNYLCIIYDGNVTSGTFTIPETVTYVRFKFDYDIDTALSDNIQLEEGSTATPYEPYKEYKKTFYLNSPLLEGDTIEQQGDNVVHVHRSEIRAYQTDDELTLPTDMTNTLVAKATPIYEVISQNDTILCDSYVNGHLDIDSVVPIKRVDFLPFEEELTYLYPSTQYAVQFVSDAVNKVDITLGGAKLLNQDVVVGTNKYTITTPSTLVDNKLVMSGVGLNIEEVVVTEATDQEFGYFEGMKSVGECEDLEVVSCNKNLLNIIEYKTWVGTNWNVDFEGFTQDGNIANQTAIICNKILKPNTVYALSFQWRNDDNEIYHRWIRLKFHTLEGNLYEEGITNLSFDPNCASHYNLFRYNGNEPEFVPQIVSFTTPNIPLVLRGVGASMCELKINSTQLEEGDTATDYIPHASNTQTLTHKPLRSTPNGAKDRFVKIGDKWYIERNIGNIRLDRNILWAFDSNVGSYGFDCEYSLVYLYDQECTKINMRTSSNATDEIYSSSNNFITLTRNQGFNIKAQKEYIHCECICIKNSRLSELTEEGFYKWLDNNETYLTYQLAKPVYEPIDYNPFTVYSEVTHISNNSTIPCNMVIKNTGFNCLLKPNTTYTISSNLGLNTVTTPSVLTEDCLRFMDTDTSDVTTMKNVLVLEGDWTTKADLIPANFSGIESAFEQEYDAEKGKYKVNIKVANEDKTKENNITFYINEPLRGAGDAKDRVFVKDDKVVVQRNCGVREYQDGDFGTYPTDKVNTVYQLAEPVYEEIEYNDTKLFIESFKNSTLFYNSNVPVTSKLYYSYSVPLVDTVAKTASISDEQDIMIIDLATQVAVMEMLLM